MVPNPRAAEDQPLSKNLSHLSVEQARYLQRMNNAVIRQAASYKHNLTLHSGTEKERYAQQIEEGSPNSKVLYQGGLEQNHSNSSQPLGKYVSQLEMKNPEARRQLRETLDSQIKEKNLGSPIGEDPRRRLVKHVRQKQQIYARPPVARQAQNMQMNASHSGNFLPPLRIKTREPSPADAKFSQSITPSRRQGYVSLSNKHLNDGTNSSSRLLVIKDMQPKEDASKSL